jgi:hypothetical protein
MSFRIPTLHVAIPVISSVLLTACGGGGGGGADDNGPDNGLTTSGYRISQISLDYDNNGVADATVSLTYEDGYLKQEVYQYTDDGVTDRYRFTDQYQGLLGRQVTTYEYDAFGRALQITQRQFDSSNAQTYYSTDVYTFRSSDPLAQPLKIDRYTQGTVNSDITSYEIEFEYENDQLVGYTRKISGSSSNLASADFTYDNGVIDHVVWVSQTGSNSAQYLQYGFSWDGNLISELAIDVDPLNNTYEGSETYVYNANNFIQSTALTFTSATYGTDAVSTFEYDSNGLPQRQSWDYENDGSIDGVLTFEVEAATCRYTYAWRAQEKPNFALSENSALPPGTGYYRLRACIVPDA